MFYADAQLIVHGDTTLHLIERNVGVTSFDNDVLSNHDVNMKLDEGYLDHFITRIVDWRQDRYHDYPQHVDNNWLYQADGNPLEVQWPLNIDMRYSAYSQAAYMSTSGGPVGDPRWEPHFDNEPIEPVLASNYDIDIINAEAYFEGDTVGTLPALEVFDGLHVLINFEFSSFEEPAAAQVALFYDSNMNGLLDPDDANLFGEEMTTLLVDNDENDMHPDYGVYEELIINEQDEFSPFMIQGAKFFMTALDANDSIIAVQTIDPYSAHATRATGQAVDSDSVAIPGLIIQVAAGGDIYYGDFNFYAAVTDSNGYYDIGMSDLEEGDFFMGTDPNEEDFEGIYGQDSKYERYITFFESDEYGWDTWFYGSFAESNGISTLVNELNTLVTGQVLDPAGNPMPFASFIETETELSVSDSLIWVFTGDAETDEEGFYSYWSMNDAQTRVTTYFEILNLILMIQYSL